MKKWLIVAVAVTLVIGVPLSVIAATGTVRSRVNRQAGMFRDSETTTSSTTFVDIPGLSGLNVCAIHEVSATVSGVVAGGPVGIQVRWDNGPIMAPGAIRVEPGGATEAFSFTFVHGVGTFEGVDRHTFAVQWRSPTGANVTLNKGTLNLLYERGASC